MTGNKITNKPTKGVLLPVESKRLHTDFLQQRLQVMQLIDLDKFFIHIIIFTLYLYFFDLSFFILFIFNCLHISSYAACFYMKIFKF